MTTTPREPSARGVGMEPTNDLRATLPDLLDALFDKGAYLDIDLVITVAEVPLIGVSLRAAVAGVETMLEYGMLQGWDEQIRRSALPAGRPALPSGAEQDHADR